MSAAMLRSIRRACFIAFAGLVAACGEAEDFESDFAPTGSHGAEDEFGRQVYLDEECGGVDEPDYADYFQNALFRDGAVHDGRLWLVDGANLWSAPVTADVEGDAEINLERSMIGHGNAVAAADGYLAVALVERGLVIYPDYDLAHPVYLSEVARAIDVDASVYRDGRLLAVAAGSQGVLVYDVSNPRRPALMYTIDTGGYAAGARWGERKLLYFAACSHVGYADFSANEPAVHVSAALAHRNAKDAHGNAERMVVANNGGGVWFYDLATLQRDSVYEIEDPNFYANAAVVDGAFAYVAAGNREIIALWMRGQYEPEARLPKDPLGITVVDDVVYGLGNFRDVGERTVVRTTALDGRPSATLAFRAGLQDWTEPNRHALNFTDAAGKEWLVRREVGGYGVYAAVTGATAWTAETAYRFYFASGTYAVSVTADGVIREAFAGATTPTEVGAWPNPFPARGWISFDGKAMLLHAGDDDGIDQRLPLSFEATPETPSTRDGSALCSFATTEEEGGVTRRRLYGFYVDGDLEISWCSRQVDPYKPGNRAAGDVGTRHQVCQDGACIGTALLDSGMLGAISLGDDRWLSLFDDRIAYTASIVEWVPALAGDFGVESTDGPAQGELQDSTYVGQEVFRRVIRGRPEGWRRLAGGGVRVWMSDGSAFTYDPAARTVADRIDPLDEGGL